MCGKDDSKGEGGFGFGVSRIIIYYWVEGRLLGWNKGGGGREEEEEEEEEEEKGEEEKGEKGGEKRERLG